jgi:16S rRNA (guanine966-N2)-methyltransferase
VGSAPGLRPTPERVRETLFNWLTPTIAGSVCLDLFSGSGALGFEAASRGASQVWLVERDRRLAMHLKLLAAQLGEPGVQVVNADARAFLKGDARASDIVFLDPPFRTGLLQQSCNALEHGGWLSAAALVYLESEAPLNRLLLPVSWRIYREGRAGDVHYGLALRERGAAS